jgi:hypothetical protein
MIMASKDDIIAARATMAKWKDFRGFSPFGSSDYTGTEDRAAPYLSQAASMLTVLSAACDDMQTLSAIGPGSEFDACSGRAMSGALDGIATLVALAAFHLED